MQSVEKQYFHFFLLEDHKLNLNYKKNNLIVSGEGKIQLDEEKSKIKYSINKNNENLDIKTELLISNINLKKQDFLKTNLPSTISLRPHCGHIKLHMLFSSQLIHRGLDKSNITHQFLLIHLYQIVPLMLSS